MDTCVVGWLQTGLCPASQQLPFVFWLCSQQLGSSCISCRWCTCLKTS